MESCGKRFCISFQCSYVNGLSPGAYQWNLPLYIENSASRSIKVNPFGAIKGIRHAQNGLLWSINPNENMESFS